ncbi:FtsQ-type POTRA domain-containing protein [Clostridium aestuarii]|uniref:FtsQ-type POTRA domain-containing protein n=1 Tax=Clostridium aestuarii TaxID=338193 RepID=A0ABT4CXJ1_9CLOT|nr:FtsQ-type POTRA domain-containing protein [Clostridium aestuarii]MCY6483718.1 FtsQ-type POTRA domain-containing protein [Clostridium aestuarii]
MTKKKTSNKYKNKLIEKRRRKIKIRRCFLFFIILISISITLCLKHPYFNVKEIQVFNNRNISSEEIKKISKLNIRKNIFYLNFKESKTNILKNPYILSTDIKRKLPNKIKIYVQERTAVFYVKEDNKYLVIDKDGIVLERKESINKMKLLKLQGFEEKTFTVGEVISKKDSRKVEVISYITDLIKRLKKGIPEPSMVDVGDLTNIKMYYGNMVIKLGTSDDIEKKFNTAINILNSNDLISKKGYIDVSFKEEPVFLVEN